jgi:hypothetical protein
MMVRLIALGGIALLVTASCVVAQTSEDRNKAVSEWERTHHETVTPSARRKLVEVPGFIDCLLGRAGSCCLMTCPASAVDVFAQVSFRLQPFPSILLNVKPIPPTDYDVLINNDKCDFSPNEKNTYRVPVGHVTVVVKRPGVKECTWEGLLASGGQTTVECNF